MKSIFDELIKRVGPHIKMALPLGIGKPNYFVNYVYRRVKENPELRLTIITALTFQRPKTKDESAENSRNSIHDKIYGDYPDLEYELDRVLHQLPKNIEVIEFFMPAGKFLNNSRVQRHYLASNYTHVARDMVHLGVNLIAQMICKKTMGQQISYSLSCNPDISLDLVSYLRTTGRPFMTVGQINQQLPFMYGDAAIANDFFDFIIDEPAHYFKLFSLPKTAVTDVDFSIGLYASTLVKDDGQLQVGIGALGDSIVHSLLLKHQNNDLYRKIVHDFEIPQKFTQVLETSGDLGPFKAGLFGATEMLVDGFMELYNAGILKKKVYDHIGLQGLINRGLLTETFDHENILKLLIQQHLIHIKLTDDDIKFLKYWGIFQIDVKLEDSKLVSKEKNLSISADLGVEANLKQISQNFLGVQLLNGHVAHGGFFAGQQKYYEWLRNLPEAERRLFAMRSVQKINQLYGHEELDRLHLKNGRFINTCMMTTLLGAHVSDGLADGRVVSGVGGQFNFVAMAKELNDARSILTMRSTRTSGNKLHSNIIFNYGHITIPRHLRDILVTEYGIADLRSKIDEEIIIELLKVADSRFQGPLIKEAKAAGKLNPEYELPLEFQDNHPEKFHQMIATYKKQGVFQSYPFGSDYLAN